MRYGHNDLLANKCVGSGMPLIGNNFPSKRQIPKLKKSANRTYHQLSEKKRNQYSKRMLLRLQLALLVAVFNSLLCLGFVITSDISTQLRHLPKSYRITRDHDEKQCLSVYELPSLKNRISSSRLAISHSNELPPTEEALSSDGTSGNHVENNRTPTQVPSDELQQISDTILKNTTTLEMTMMSTIGFAVSLGVLFTLAMDSEMRQTSTQMDFLADLFSAGDKNIDLIAAEGLTLVEESFEDLEVISRTLISTAVPQSATDVLAVALGEGIAGVIGAFSTWCVASVLRLRTDANAAAEAASNAVGDVVKKEVAEKGRIFDFMKKSNTSRDSSSNEMIDGIITEAIADGDYFLTRAAAIPLLESVGVPRFTATLASVVLATIPYELIKLTSRKRKMKEQEKIIFDDLLLRQLQEDEERKRKMIPSWPTGDTQIIEESVSLSASMSTQQDEVKKDDLTEITVPQPGLDSVEIFTDMTKWLEYDVLTKDFSGILTFNGNVLSPGVESAFFGFLAVLSAQLYADTLSIYSNFGTEEARAEVRSRPIDQWALLYSTKCINGAALFGVYETVRVPISKFIRRLLDGGLDSCLGSKEFDLCLETYMVNNPTGATWDAQVRAFFSAVASLLYRVNTEFSEGIDFHDWVVNILS